MYKKALVILGLVGIIGWGIYHNNFSTNESKNTNQNSELVTNNLETGVHEGEKAPDFQQRTLAGEEMALSDLEGKKVIINFWATWCPPCKAEMPHMQDFYHNQKENNVEILAVNLTETEKDERNIKNFVQDYGLTFPVLLDRSGEIGKTYQAITIPTSYFIDSKGIIRKKIIGPMDKEMMTELINNMD